MVLHFFLYFQEDLPEKNYAIFKPQNMQLEPRHIDAPYWPTLLFVGIFVLLACARVLYPKRF